MKKILMAAAAAVFAVSGAASAETTVKIAWIDPLSGAFASTGQKGLQNFQFAADYFVNNQGGIDVGGEMVKFEILPYDGAEGFPSPKKSTLQAEKALGEGATFIAQGNSSGVAAALTDFVGKTNRRNPDNPVVFLNYSAVDPALTNDLCNFWHFRFDANSDIKMDALTDVMAADPNMKKVYLIGQDYSFGQAVAAGAERMLAAKRPDIEIVGNELHPIGQVQDFTPYARNVKASGADALITGNWGGDMVGLGKAILEADLGIPVYTYYAAADGITGLFGEAGDGVIGLVSEGWTASPTAEFQAYHAAFKAQFPDSDISQPRIINVIGMLAQAMQAAGTTDPKAVAMAMENMEYDSMLGTKVFMRAEDHQAFQNVHIQTHTNDGLPTNADGNTMDFDNSGYGVLSQSTIEMASMGMETTCDMKRP